ncbi:DUF2141 domain-containing protein [Vaginella massiliensis]|uniref:DUF2141 domain-containing protein n=1 Tax=Vaginella massiliensis TaxID=1816680 RepID=UPI00083958B9|nr:DUF2141 domain-containing protein [Vaginella massiliensis]
MKRHLYFFFLLLASFGFAQNHLKEFTLNIENLKGQEGFLKIDIYRNVENYTKDANAYKSFYIKVDEMDRYELSIKDFPNNVYAIKVFLDKNENKTLDKTWIGIRKEPYAFSGNIRTYFREPTFEEAKIEITRDNREITLYLR